jgi:hypothetical protein
MKSFSNKTLSNKSRSNKSRSNKSRSNKSRSNKSRSNKSRSNKSRSKIASRHKGGDASDCNIEHLLFRLKLLKIGQNHIVGEGLPLQRVVNVFDDGEVAEINDTIDDFLDKHTKEKEKICKSINETIIFIQDQLTQMEINPPGPRNRQ